ncbi:ABC transporter permease [Nocardia carnea]|uniref:ABC transporter permease n=1 Tax=Nocardia carnea TaxID=37328 RepID=UPI0024584BD4|nr:ABC transporter permease subunit [Nocardia carnea]
MPRGELFDPLFGAAELGAALSDRAWIAALIEVECALARAKGLPERRVATGHALRTALLPIATNATMAAGALVSGAVVVETVFSYPGLGKVIADAVAARDYPMLQGAFLLATLGVILANILADLLYPLLDPRVRHSRQVVPA